MARITGIGGVFLQAKTDAKALAAWYERHLGLSLAPWGGAVLRWSDDAAKDGGATAWHVFANDGDAFAPSTAPFMINYRVDDMHGMVSRLKGGGVTILKGPEYDERGIFLWIVDPDGNKVELWEPRRDPKGS